MAHHRLRIAFAAAALIAAAFGLAACGRNGPPLPPPGPVATEPPPAAPTAAAPPPVPGTTEAAQATAQKNGFDSLGNPVAPVGQKKSFPLDPLLQ